MYCWLVWFPGIVPSWVVHPALLYWGNTDVCTVQQWFLVNQCSGSALSFFFFFTEQGKGEGQGYTATLH